MPGLATNPTQSVGLPRGDLPWLAAGSESALSESEPSEVVGTVVCARDAGENRILMSPSDFSKRCALVDDMLEQRIVVEEIDRARVCAQTAFQVADHASQTGLGKRIEEIEDRRIGRERECGRVRPYGFQRKAPARLAVITV